MYNCRTKKAHIIMRIISFKVHYIQCVYNVAVTHALLTPVKNRNPIAGVRIDVTRAAQAISNLSDH